MQLLNKESLILNTRFFKYDCHLKYDMLTPVLFIRRIHGKKEMYFEKYLQCPHKDKLNSFLQ